MTTLDLSGLVRPHLVEMTKREDNPNAAEFRLQPLERGYGHTLGNSLRRMLLSSLRGTAVWAFRLDGVVHDYAGAEQEPSPDAGHGVPKVGTCYTDVECDPTYAATIGRLVEVDLGVEGLPHWRGAIA